MMREGHPSAVRPLSPPQPHLLLLRMFPVFSLLSLLPLLQAQEQHALQASNVEVFLMYNRTVDTFKLSIKLFDLNRRNILFV